MRDRDFGDTRTLEIKTSRKRDVLVAERAGFDITPSMGEPKTKKRLSI
jgi:hypothetical protein